MGVKKYKPVRYYAGDDFHIEEERWSRKPERLKWYCDVGDTLWRLVDDKIRAMACGTYNKRGPKPKGEMFDDSRESAGIDNPSQGGHRTGTGRDPGDQPSKRNRGAGR